MITYPPPLLYLSPSPISLESLPPASSRPIVNYRLSWKPTHFIFQLKHGHQWEFVVTTSPQTTPKTKEIWAEAKNKVQFLWFASLLGQSCPCVYPKPENGQGRLICFLCTSGRTLEGGVRCAAVIVFPGQCQWAACWLNQVQNDWREKVEGVDLQKRKGGGERRRRRRRRRRSGKRRRHSEKDILKKKTKKKKKMGRKIWSRRRRRRRRFEEDFKKKIGRNQNTQEVKMNAV